MNNKHSHLHATAATQAKFSDVGVCDALVALVFDQGHKRFQSLVVTVFEAIAAVVQSNGEYGTAYPLPVLNTGVQATLEVKFLLSPRPLTCTQRVARSDSAITALCASARRS
jgi:hypothetical protein